MSAIAPPPTAAQTLGSLVRTLSAAGYVVCEAVRQPTHIEIFATFADEFGTSLRYLFALSEDSTVSEGTKADMTQSATASAASLVIVTPESSETGLSVVEVMRRLGGPIPSWRALAPEYFSELQQLGQNSLPAGYTGQAWQHFEDAVADGIEFLLGMRVKRLGRKYSGSRYPDSILHAPDNSIALVDAKAAAAGFDAVNAELRAMKEYALQQLQIQGAAKTLSSCLVASSSFLQSPEQLLDTAHEFLAEVGVPLSFVTCATLAEMIDAMMPRPRLRPSIRWRRVLCTPGLLSAQSLHTEVQIARDLQMGGTA